MTMLIQWRLMFRVSNRRAFDKCLARALPLFGSGVKLGECKPYWKIPELWECNLVSTVSPGSTADQVLACLLLCQSLASRWYIVGPRSAESACFSGVFDKRQGGTSSPLAWLEWASFELVTSGGDRTRCANGSQPIRAETNRTSSAAGSRR
jgi:hypothetical protein